MDISSLNAPNKRYHEPMHTAEHILNQTMVRMFYCGRCYSAHIEEKKSKCDYKLETAPADEKMLEVEKRVNEVIEKHLPVVVELMSRIDAQKILDLSRLPVEAGETLRIARIGNYDICPCIGMHVKNTSEIGIFKIISYDFADGRLRVRFKLLDR
jgi:Ser-tRNA(Ala) deacylase AlaX